MPRRVWWLALVVVGVVCLVLGQVAHWPTLTLGLLAVVVGVGGAVVALVRRGR